MIEDSNPSKRCIHCGETKPLELFPTAKKRKDGRRSHCKACAALKQRERRAANPEEHRRNARVWREKNPEKVRESSLAYYEANREKILETRRKNPEKNREAARKWRAANPERNRQNMRAWYAANPERVRQLRKRRYDVNGEKIREASRKRYAENPEKIRAQVRAYKKANPEKVRASRQRHYAANRERILARRAIYCEIHRERLAKARREAYAANPHRWPRNKDKRREYSRAYRQANLEKLKEYLRNWQKTHPEHNRARASKRRAKMQGNGGVFTAQELAEMRAEQNGVCAYCKGQYHPDALVVEHIIPICQGGRHERKNICLACRTCNTSKGPRTPEQWTNRWYLRKKPNQ